MIIPDCEEIPSIQLMSRRMHCVAERVPGASPLVKPVTERPGMTFKSQALDCLVISLKVVLQSSSLNKEARISDTNIFNVAPPQNHGLSPLSE